MPSRAHWKQIVAILVVIAFVLPLASAPEPILHGTSNPHSSSARIGYTTLPLQAIGSPSYDEQVGITLTQSSFLRLDFNVTAVEQTDQGFGPAYLVNGLTGQGYWYQVGLSYAWPRGDGSASPGFNMSYEVFSPQGISVFPANGGGLDNLQVNPGDLVLLSLYFSNGNVIMKARDWNTTSTFSETYPAYGATTFIGLPNQVARNGFFTGLMTEEYHLYQYNGAGSPTFYSTSQSIGASVWMWADEQYLGQYPYDVFRATTSSPVRLNNTLADYFSSNGTAEFANSHGLVTGLPSTIPVASASAGVGYSNHQAELAIIIGGASGEAVLFANMTIQSTFSNYNVSSATPFVLNGDTASYNITLNLPGGVSVGNYTLTVRVSSWKFLVPQANEWVPLPPTKFNETLRVTSLPPPQTQPPSGGSNNSGSSQPSGSKTPGPGSPGLKPSRVQAAPNLLSQLWTARMMIIPAILLYMTVVSILAVLVIRQDKKHHLRSAYLAPTMCPTCGNPVTSEDSSCQICGVSPPTSPGNETTAKNQQFGSS